MQEIRLKEYFLIIKMVDFKFQKVFSIHFPEKQVYIEYTFKTLEEKLEEIKKDVDHYLYEILMTMFHHLKNYPKHNYLQKRNSIQS